MFPNGLFYTYIFNLGKTRVLQFRTFPSISLSLSLSLFRDRLFSADAIASSSPPQVLTLVPYSSFFLSFQLFSVWFIRKKAKEEKKK